MPWETVPALAQGDAAVRFRTRRHPAPLKDVQGLSVAYLRSGYRPFPGECPEIGVFARVRWE